MLSTRRWTTVPGVHFLTNRGIPHEISGQGIGALIRASSPAGSILPNSLKLHTHVEALVKPTRGTLFSGGNRDRTARTPQAYIVLSILYGSLEETFARLTGEYTVMKATYLVTAYWARAVDELLAG